MSCARSVFYAGISKPCDDMNPLMFNFLAMTHSPAIKQIDTVRAYYCGPRQIVEVDVVLDKDERVEVAHDTAEELQIKLEKLPFVERAYVHIDYETSHSPVSLDIPAESEFGVLLTIYHRSILSRS